MELAVSKIGQKVCHCFVLRYKNIKIVNSVQVQVARTREGVNILSSVESRSTRLKTGCILIRVGAPNLERVFIRNTLASILV